MNLGYDLCEVRSGLSAEELWNVEKYFNPSCPLSK